MVFISIYFFSRPYMYSANNYSYRIIISDKDTKTV